MSFKDRIKTSYSQLPLSLFFIYTPPNFILLLLKSASLAVILPVKRDKRRTKRLIIPIFGTDKVFFSVLDSSNKTQFQY